MAPQGRRAAPARGGGDGRYTARGGAHAQVHGLPPQHAGVRGERGTAARGDAERQGRRVRGPPVGALLQAGGPGRGGGAPAPRGRLRPGAAGRIAALSVPRRAGAGHQGGARTAMVGGREACAPAAGPAARRPREGTPMTPATALRPAAARRSRPLELLRRYPLLSYVLIAYAFTWALDLLFLVLFPLPDLPLGRTTPRDFGPPVAALVVTAAIAGKPGVRRLLRRLVLWRVH